MPDFILTIKKNTNVIKINISNVIKILMDYENFFFFLKNQMSFFQREEIEALILTIFSSNTIASKLIKKI